MSCGAVVGKSRHNAAGRSGSFGTAGVTRLFPRLRPALGSPLRGPPDPSFGISSTQQQPVEARSEAGGQQIVCLAGGRLLRVGPRPGEGEPLTEEGDRKHDEDRRAADRRNPRAVLDEAAPSVGDRLAQWSRLAARDLRRNGARRSSPRSTAASDIPTRASGWIVRATPTRPTAIRESGDESPPSGQFDP